MAAARPAPSLGPSDGSTCASAVSCIALDPESRRAATGHADGSLSVWEIESAESNTTFVLHGGPVTSVLFASGGRQLISASDDRTVRASDLTGGASRIVASIPRVMRTITLCAVAEKPFAILQSFDRHVLRVLDLGGVLPPVEVRDSRRRFAAALFLDELTVLALTETGALEIWGAAKPTPHVSIESDLDAPLRVGVSGAGSLMVIGDARGVVKAWDRGSANLLFEVNAHQDAVHSLAVDESGTYFASVGADSTVRIASAATGEGIAECSARRDVSCCALTSDLSVLETGYRVHAGTRAPVLLVVGNNSGEVEFIECAGLTSGMQGRAGA